MPFNPQQINPLDLNPNVAIGVNLPFSSPSVFTPNYTTAEAIKNNLINFFLTNPGDIPLNPTFGGGLRNFIFTQIAEDNIAGLKSNVELKIENYFPYINIESLEVLKNDNENTLVVKLFYSIKNTNLTNNITLEF
jgi:phage baseplate assembly protein W